MDEKETSPAQPIEKENHTEQIPPLGQSQRG